MFIGRTKVLSEDSTEKQQGSVLYELCGTIKTRYQSAGC